MSAERTMRSLDTARRVGVVTPSANPAVEPEVHALLPEGVIMHATRLPVFPGDLRERTRQYAAAYAPALASFGALALEAFYIAMTGTSYPLGLAGDRTMVQELASQVDAPVWTATLAIHDALVAVEADTVVLVSPYPAWLTDEAVAYWEGAGVRIAQVVRMSEEFRAYELGTQDVLAALAQAKPPRGSVIVFSGTGLLALPAIVRARRDAGRPLLSPNLCGAWKLLATLGMAAGPALIEASPDLAATLADKLAVRPG